MTRARVLICAPIGDGSSGGTQTVALGLASGFRQLGDVGLDLSWFALAGKDDWLLPELPEGTEVIHARDLGVGTRAAGFAARRVGAIAEMLPGGSFWFPPKWARGSSVQPLELDFDLVHFVTQGTFYTGGIPFIYQPHDLQHEHYPEYFSGMELALRRMRYGANIRSATMTVVASRYIADDVERIYPQRKGPISVIPLAPIQLPESPTSAAWTASLPDQFAFYPAAAWPHKNHETLFRAISLLRDRGIRVPLVLTGAKAGRVDLEELAQRFGVDDLVTHLGFVSPTELSLLYSRATVTVIPTLYEAGSFPMFEAFSKGCPVVASAVCSLPQQAAEAAMLFNPYDSNDLAEQLAKVWTDRSSQVWLRAAGLRRAEKFTWAATAQGYAAAYRQALRLPPTVDDIVWREGHARF